MRRSCLLFIPVILWAVLKAPSALAEAQQVEVSVLAEVPLERAWEILQDFSVAHNYVPGLTRTEIVSSRPSGIGAHRRVYDEQGDFIEETIIEWQEREGFVIKIHQGDAPMAPFERAEFSYRLAPVPDSKTLIILGMTVELPFGSVGAKLGEWFILPVIEDNLVQVAAGMKHYYETGRPATDEDREMLAGVVRVGQGPAITAP